MTFHFIAESVSSNLIDFNTELLPLSSAAAAATPGGTSLRPAPPLLASPTGPEYVNGAVQAPGGGGGNFSRHNRPAPVGMPPPSTGRDPFDMSESVQNGVFKSPLLLIVLVSFLHRSLFYSASDGSWNSLSFSSFRGRSPTAASAADGRVVPWTNLKKRGRGKAHAGEN